MADILFLAGAPKCGTSKIFNLLSNHPHITGSSIKESFFYIDSDSPLVNPELNIHKDSKEEFRTLFDCGPSSKILLEGTTHTIYQHEVLSQLAEFNKAKFLFVLRNPIDRLRSSFQYTKHNLARFKRDLSFEKYCKFLLNDESHLLTNYIKDFASFWVLERDLVYGRYAVYLKEWYERFESEQLKIVFFEEFFEHPYRLLNEIVDWLALEPMQMPEEVLKNKKNATVSVRNRFLQDFAWRLNKVLPKGPAIQKLKQIYAHFQYRPKEEVEISTDLYRRLQAYYEPHNQELSVLIGREIPKWNNAR
ncbi:MAG: sulfotransferase domain-containing protein [Bacteroidota bacterium]